MKYPSSNQAAAPTALAVGGTPEKAIEFAIPSRYKICGTVISDSGHSGRLADVRTVDAEGAAVMGRAKIAIPKDTIADFCRKHHIRRLALFGSVLRDDFDPQSDVDVLVDFEAGHTPGLAFFTMEKELSDIIGRKVDLNTPNFLSRYFRERVLAEAETQYVA